MERKLRRSSGRMCLILRRRLRGMRWRRGAIQWRKSAGQRGRRMGKMRAPGHAGLRWESRGRLGRMLLVLIIVGIEGTALGRRRIGRIARLLGRRLRIVRRSPRHGGRVCRGTRRRALEGDTSDRERRGDGERERKRDRRTRSVMMDEGWPCAKGVERFYLTRMSRGAITRRLVAAVRAICGRN
ncbi:hypothetical protein BO71DRAFT_105888 [Aspergillus ellipticus CBS 707.79]|uniref:Uncharacterized protein n=1 Tax=Aspergillus ellipticus CBS 707.79 TaxID=1448320 RepID=A0A319CXV1_9EURO|nr:hypothetical protein BO71DRAFT_105888 [Aspergillus ellipticus CBS 707.79]